MSANTEDERRRGVSGIYSLTWRICHSERSEESHPSSEVKVEADEIPRPRPRNDIFSYVVENAIQSYEACGEANLEASYFTLTFPADSHSSSDWMSVSDSRTRCDSGRGISTSAASLR